MGFGADPAFSGLDWAPAGLRYLQRRNFTNIPWVLTGVSPCTDTTWPSSIPTQLTGNPSQYYTVTYQVPHWRLLHDQRQDNLGQSVPANDFDTKIAAIKQAAQQTYGSKYGQSDP